MYSHVSHTRFCPAGSGSSPKRKPLCSAAKRSSSAVRSAERTAELERLAAEHNGFLFGELPLPAGQKRVWETWEYIYYPMMGGAFVLYGLIFYFKPHDSIQEWARTEALSRMVAKADGAEEEE
mmetsp:Transcript_19326/g.32804  ORF Transcript_19326/g.32804 Transcript_19326/m.32804 type:complete len:123 (-) Transcript_19326:536-904(-)